MTHDVEEELLLDRMIYGTSFHKIVDGKKVRIPPNEVYFKPRWWVRFWYWLKRIARR